MYISIDGDNIGKRLERYILHEDIVSLGKLSNYITATLKQIENIINENKGEIFLLGGDNVLAKIQDQSIEYIVRYIENINKNNEVKFSMGFSNNISTTYLALKYAKSIGHGTIVYAVSSSEKIEYEIISKVNMI